MREQYERSLLQLVSKRPRTQAKANVTYLAYQKRHQLHHALPLRHRPRIQDVQCQHRHKQCRVLHRNLQHRQTRLWTEVLGGNLLLAHVGRERKERAQEGHAVHVVLPDVEAFRAEVDGEGAMNRGVVVQVQRYRLGNVDECTERASRYRARGERAATHLVERRLYFSIAM